MYLPGSKQPKLVKVGCSYFVDNQQFTMCHPSFPKRVIQLLAASQLQIQGDYYNHNWKQVFSMIYKSDITHFKLSNLTRSDKAPLFNQQIINNIVHVKFTQLKYLSFYTCNIVSIEAIAWIDAPKLEKLHFIQNFINSLTGITKLNNPQLKSLILYSKKPAGLDLRKLHRIKAKLNCLSLEMPKNSATILHDLRLLAKLQTPKAQKNYYYRTAERSSIQVKIGTKKRIEQQKVKQLLRKHYPSHLDFTDSSKHSSSGNRIMVYGRMVEYDSGYDDYDGFDYGYDAYDDYGYY